MAHLTTVPPVCNPMRVRVLAADSNAMSTQLLVEALGREKQLHMIECPASVPALLALVNREKPQVAVLCSKLSERSGGNGSLLREIRNLSPSTRVILLLDAPERTAVIEALRAGAQGVFCRTEPFRLLGECIECVHQGRVWIKASELQYLVEAIAEPSLTALHSDNLSLLSSRDRDVVRCLTEGLSNREIAHRLKLTEHTVKNYLFRIFDKLGVSSRVEVVLFALGDAARRNSGSNDKDGEHTQVAPVRPQAVAPAPLLLRRNAN